MLSGFCLTDTNYWYRCAGHLGDIRAYWPRPQQLRPCLALGTCTSSFISLFVSAAAEEFFLSIRILGSGILIYSFESAWSETLSPRSYHSNIHLVTPGKHPSDSGLPLLKSASFLVMCKKAKTSTRGERSDTALCLFTRVIFHERSDAS